MKTPKQLVEQPMEFLWSFQPANRKDEIYPPS